MKPLVTVLLPVYNAGPFLAEAIKSVLQQTFENFELLVIDDGSTDTSRDIIASFHDKRIRFITHDTNKKLIETLNEGVSLAKGDLIARMDADDIMMPTRLEEQVILLQNQPNVVAVGSDCEIIDMTGAVLRYHHTWHADEVIRRVTAVICPFIHGSVTMRKAAVMKVGGYSDTAYLVEDYDLWTRLATIGSLVNIDKVLYQWRLTETGESSRNWLKQQKASAKVAESYWKQFDSQGPAPKSVWATFDKEKADPGRLADLHLHFAKAYYREGKRGYGLQHILAAWQLRPLLMSFYLYYILLPILPISWFVRLELALQNRWRRA